MFINLKISPQTFPYTVYNDLVHSRSYEMPAIAIEGFHDWLHDVWMLPDRLVQEGFSDTGQGTLNGKTSLIYETTGTGTFDEAVGPQSTRAEIKLVRDAPLLHRETHYTDGVKDKETILIRVSGRGRDATGPIGPSWSGKGRKTPPEVGGVFLCSGVL